MVSIMASSDSGAIATRDDLLKVEDRFLPLTVAIYAPRPSLDRIIPRMKFVCAFLFSDDGQMQDVLGVDSLEALFNALGEFEKPTARADGGVAPCSESSRTQRPLRFLRAVRLALSSLA